MSSETVNRKDSSYMKNYYELNKDKFKEWSQKKIHCEFCEKDITAPNFATHCKSTSHKKNCEIKKIRTDVPQDKVIKLLDLFMDKLKDKDFNELKRELNGISNLVINE